MKILLHCVIKFELFSVAPAASDDPGRLAVPNASACWTRVSEISPAKPAKLNSMVINGFQPMYWFAP